MYNPEQPFGGISIMLLGNFIQLPVVTGRDLWSIMYGNVNGDDATAQNLFQQFHIHELKTNMQAAECKTHTRRIQAFHALPPKYPSGHKWSAIDNKNDKPITQDIIDGVTHELTSQQIQQDPNWITKSTCIVTSNVDRAIINAKAAEAFGKRNKIPVFWWKRQLRNDFPKSAQAILYDEEERPEMYAYFVEGGPGQILDYAHGNVYFGVANGTPCTMHSLAWDNAHEEEDALQAIAKGTPGEVIDLPTASDHIVVNIKPKPGITWPQHLNLTPGSNFI
jgi:hypothetical protein